MFLEKLAAISARFIKIGNTRISFAGSFVCCSTNRSFAFLLLVVYRSVLWNPWNQEEFVGWENNCSYAQKEEILAEISATPAKKAKYECMNGD